jgi:selenocysteine-specific elongation factor
MPDRPSSIAPAPRSVILGTAGHIDHGKTALVGALTGIDTDRLPEEKSRGITIDLGFASLETQAPDGAALRLSFIDVPGHARFVRNMLAGAGGIDAVLMVIAADEGVKPQTEEHLAICTLLGIVRGLTVLTKADAVSEERLRETTRAVKTFVGGTLLASGPVIAVSAHTGFGIAELRRELIRLASRVPVRSPDAVFRLPIDRAFVMKGFGTVVTGTLIGGSIRAGDELAILPGERTTRVRGIQVHGRAEEEARAGSRVALNLARIETAELRRGDILVAPSSVQAVDIVDVELGVLSGASTLKHRSRVHFHAFASECMAAATLHDAASVGPGETGLARLRLSEPIVLLPDDHFVLRLGTPITTVGGGRILDAHPSVQIRKAKTAEWLRQLRAASSEERVWLRIARRGVTGISAKKLSRETGITEAALGGLLQRWIREGRVHLAGEKCLLTQESFAVARETILEQLRLRSGASSSGVRRSELREQTGLDSGVFDDALRRMEQNRQLQVAGDFVMLCGGSSGSGHDRDLQFAIAAEYERAGITPPSPDELGVRMGIAPAEMRRLITLLLRGGTLVRLSDDSLCMHRRVLDALADRIRSLRGQTLDIAAFKQLAGVSRKYAIPLLEYLDRERITVKQGSQRLVL